jgi:hypothetical protein
MVKKELIMANQQLIDYIKSQLLKNIDLIQIKQMLQSKGWSEYDINEATNIAKNVAQPTITSLQPNHEEQSKKPKLWIFIIITALIIAGIFVFLVINKNNGSSETKTAGIQAPANSSKNAGIIDCGYSDSCFSNYVKHVPYLKQQLVTKD